MDNTNKVPTMLSIRQVAKQTGLGERYLRTLVRDKKIVYTKSGPKYLINLEKLGEYLNSIHD